jgi:acetyltransferase-like isoleucine patch superfamily enzyme
MKNIDNVIINPDASIDKSAFIDDFVVIGRGVVIKRDVYLSKGVKIYGKTIINSGTYIGENCIIGHPQRSHLKGIITAKKKLSDFESPQVEIGKDCIIRAGTIIYSEVSIKDNCQTGHNVLIREKSKIEENTIVGTNSIIDGNVTIGRNVSIQTGVYIPPFSIIGNNVFMGPFCKLTNDKYMMRKKYDLIGPTIEDNVSLGANSIIFPAIKIRFGTIVGAGAVVTKNTNEKDIIIGNPGTFLKKVPDEWK